MIVKLLNGDLLAVETLTDLASELKIHPSQIEIVGDDKYDSSIESIQSMKSVIIHPRRQIKICLSAILFKDMSWCYAAVWLENAVNESILRLIVDKFGFEKFPPLLANPHPFVVSRIMQAMDFFTSTESSLFCRRFLCMNPSDVVIDFVTKQNPEIFRLVDMCLNSNPRMQKYVIEQHKIFVSMIDSVGLKQTFTQFPRFETGWDWGRLMQSESTEVLQYVFANLNSPNPLISRTNTVWSVPRSAHPLAMEMRLKQCKEGSCTNLGQLLMFCHDEELFKMYIDQSERMSDHVMTIPHDIIVDWLITHPEQIRDVFSANCHPRAVEYLLANPQYIDEKFCFANSDERMIERCNRYEHLHEVWWFCLRNSRPDHVLKILESDPKFFMSYPNHDVLAYFSKFEEFDLTIEVL